MKKQFGIAALLLIPAGAALARVSVVQEKKAAPAAAGKDDPAALKMAQFATPGPNHKTLDVKSGKWTTEMKMFGPDGAEAMPASKGTSEVKWIMEGRYLQETFTADMMGEFHGEGRTGFDNLKKKYVNTWLDSAGTGIYYSEGTFDAGSKTFTFNGEMPDPEAGKYVKLRTVEKWTDNDHFTFTMFVPGPDGKEFKNMEIHYTRSK